MRRRSSQARNGSLLFCTMTGPDVMFVNIAVAFFFQSVVCTATTTFVPPAVHRTSLCSATYLPAGSLSEATLPVARFQIAGSSDSPFNDRKASWEPSGDHLIPRTGRLSGNTAVL